MKTALLFLGLVLLVTPPAWSQETYNGLYEETSKGYVGERTGSFYFSLGESLLNSNQDETASKAFEKAVKLGCPKPWLAYYRLALLSARVGAYDKAREYLEKGLLLERP